MKRAHPELWGCNVNIGQIEQVIEIEPLMEPVEIPDRPPEAEPVPLSWEVVPA